MGFYDANCSITGVSLLHVDAVLVIVRRTPGGGYRPVALPMRGGYDMFGAIDTPVDDPTAERLVPFLVEQAHNGRLFTSWRLFWPPTEHPATLHGAIEIFERNTTEWLGFEADTEPTGESDVTFDGVPLVFTLISQHVWDAIVASGTGSTGTAAEFDAVFRGDEFPTLLYRDRLNLIGTPLHELHTVDEFVTDRGMRWLAHTDGLAATGWGQQHSEEEQDEWLERARTVFADDAVLQSGLSGYANALAEERA